MHFDISMASLQNLGLTQEEFQDAYEICEGCNGNGGYEMSDDVEIYDDWNTCEHCKGYGFILIERGC